MNKAERAIIMAAGLGNRMRPVTLTTPKPLVKVNGERMIDTVIQGLHENGITEIYIVVGYLKEQFYALEQEYPGVTIIENPYYDTCNNISSLYVARDHIENAMILDGDQIVYNGVEDGIERVSKFIMPVLLIMVIGIAIFSLTLKTTLDDGTVRTGLQGLKVYMKPDLTGITVGRFLQITLDAMSQLFFSLSVSMGIMITYGSYVKKDVDLNKAVSQIEIMDTGVAFLAGVMIIPAVFVFSGLDGMSAGPGLMFVSLPKVFYSMGTVGRVIGILFFVLAGFAALTSCISVLESITANCMELFHTERKKTTRVLSVIYLIATAVIALGYSIFYVEVALPNGSTGQLLDIMDYISNSFMMPFISLLSAILIGWIMKPSWIAEEMELNGEKFKRKKLYNVMMRYIMPVIMVILFLQSTGVLNLIMK